MAGTRLHSSPVYTRDKNYWWCFNIILIINIISLIVWKSRLSFAANSSENPYEILHYQDQHCGFNYHNDPFIWWGYVFFIVMYFCNEKEYLNIQVKKRKKLGVFFSIILYCKGLWQVVGVDCRKVRKKLCQFILLFLKLSMISPSYTAKSCERWWEWVVAKWRAKPRGRKSTMRLNSNNWEKKVKVRVKSESGRKWK